MTSPKNIKDIKITLIGKIIRRTNIDELPQLFNILKGDMSFVGPRPCLASQLDLIALRKENLSLNLKPGLTGIAQIKSYNGMTVQKKSELDGIYAKNFSYIRFRDIVKNIFIFTKNSSCLLRV